MQLSVKEELANAITHGIAALFSLFGTILLIQKAQIAEHPYLLLSFIIYGFSIIFLFTASTLYHSFHGEAIKKKLRVFDHIGIYLMIAGTYTPFTLVTLNNSWGIGIFIAVWTIAIFGIAFKLFFTGRYEKISLASYLVMGWIVIIAIKPMIEAIHPNGLWLMVAGGVSFSIGTIFYRWHSLPYQHAIWHVFVMLGGGFHYFAVLYYTI
jgi:hemolysin III